MIAHTRTATVAVAGLFRARRHMAICLLIAAAVMACNTTHAVQPPTVDRLVPAGGQRGTTVPVKITGKLGEGELRVVNESGQPGHFSWTFNEKRDAVDVVIGPTAHAGVHWVRFCNPAGSTELRPFVVGTIPEIAETEPNNRIADANSVQSESVTINAALEKGGDVDTYAVPVAAGRTLVASITASRVLKSPMDGVLQVVDSRGTVVAQNDDDASRDPLVEFTAPADGTWYVRVFAFPAEPNSSIAFAGGADYLYRLTVTTADCLHHASPLVRQIGTGELRLQLHGWNLQAPEAVLGATHQSLEGPFALPWKVPAVPEPVLIEDQLAETRSLTPPVAVSASLLQSAADVYVVNVVKGAKFSIVAQVEDFSSLLDPVLTLTDPAGKVVKESDDGEGGNRDARIDFTATVDGPHQIAVHDRFLAAGPRFFYLLRIFETWPEVQLTVKSTAILLSGDKPAEVAVAVARRNGYVEPLDFRVQGLPEGVAAECPQSAKDGDSSKAVTIRLSGRPAGLGQWAGPIQILASPPAAADQPPVAAPVPVEYSAADGTLIRSFWLTIPPLQAAPAPAG